MTLAAAVPISSFIGNGSTNSFPFNFPAFLPGDIVVQVTNNLVPATTYLLVIGQDYTVSGLSVQGGPALPGSITLVNNSQAWLTSGFLTSGWTLVITRVVQLAQNTSLRNQGDFYPEVIENGLDSLEMQIQQLQAAISSAGAVAAPATSVILPDTSNGHTYRILMVNGVISSQQVT